MVPDQWRRGRWGAALIAGLVMAGCKSDAVPDPDTCSAAAYQNLLGQDRAMGQSLPDPKRTFGQNDPVTMDFVANRLNIQVDDSDTIVAITCG